MLLLHHHLHLRCYHLPHLIHEDDANDNTDDNDAIILRKEQTDQYHRLAAINVQNHLDGLLVHRLRVQMIMNGSPRIWVIACATF